MNDIEKLEEIKNSKKAMLSVKEAALLIGVHPVTLRRYMKLGGLKYIQPVRKVFILPKDLADWFIRYRKRKMELV